MDTKKKKKKEQGRTRLFGIPLIMPFLRPYVPTVALMIFLGILSSLADTIYPLFNSWALDHFVAERTLDGLPVFLFLYILLMILQELDNYYCLYQCGKVEVEIDRDLRNAAFAHLQTLSFSYFNQNSVGYIHARTMSDTERIGELMAWRMMDVVWNVSYIVCVTGVMLAVNARLALYVLVMVPAADVFSEKNRRREPQGPGDQLTDHRKFQRGDHGHQKHKVPADRGHHKKRL